MLHLSHPFLTIVASFYQIGSTCRALLSASAKHLSIVNVEMLLLEGGRSGVLYHHTSVSEVTRICGGLALGCSWPKQVIVANLRCLNDCAVVSSLHVWSIRKGTRVLLGIILGQPVGEYCA